MNWPENIPGFIMAWVCMLAWIAVLVYAIDIELENRKNKRR